MTTNLLLPFLSNTKWENFGYPEWDENFITIGFYPECKTCHGYGYGYGHVEKLNSKGQYILNYTTIDCPNCEGSGYANFIVLETNK